MKGFKKNTANNKGAKSLSLNNKLSEDMENQIKDSFTLYDPNNTGYINRQNLRSVLGNFAFTKMNGKEIQDQITNAFQDKQTFSLSQTVQLITKKWFFGRGRQEEALDMFGLFDRKQKGLVGINEIKNVFNQYLDINISDNDILEFIEQADHDKDGYLNQQQFFAKQQFNYSDQVINDSPNIIINFMIINIIKNIKYFNNQAKLVPVKIQIGKKVFTYQFQEFTKLARNLEKIKAPLDFQCGMGCSCGTCPVSLNQADYDLLVSKQPILENQNRVLTENAMENNVRLSCQLTVEPFFQNLTFVIEVQQ